MVMPIVFLHKNGEEVELGIDSLVFKDEAEFSKTSEETLIAILKDMGYNVVHILSSGESYSYV